jgi:hypothetical protein
LVDTGRDLACPALWQESLERSLARRGRPTRSSPELFHLRPERDLSRPDLLRESLMYSQLRRSAARRPSMALPGAGGISALALLAATTLPGLLGGRVGGRERIAYRADARDARSASTPAAGLAVDPNLAATPSKAATAGTTGQASASVPAAPAAEPAHVVAPRPANHLRAAASSSPHRSRTTAATRHVALAHDATDRGASRSVAHAESGGAAAPKLSAVPRVSAEPQPFGHPSTGGGAIEAASHPQAPARTPKTPAAAHAPAASHPPSATPAPAASRPPAATHTPTAPRAPAPSGGAGTTTHPVSTARPAPTAPARPSPPAAPGRYVNPLAAASLTPERIDQGVDYSGSGTLGAIGNGKVVYVGTSGTGWPGAFIEYRLTDGADAGRYVYYAESISPAAGLHVGQTVRPGQPIASINGGIEVGWGSGVGTQPAAQADGQWSGGSDAGNHATPDGKSFSALIAQLGGPPGKVEG